MSKIESIRKAIEQLSARERKALRAWLARRDAEEWDRQFERDVKHGRLEFLFAEAKSEKAAGRLTAR